MPNTIRSRPSGNGGVERRPEHLVARRDRHRLVAAGQGAVRVDHLCLARGEEHGVSHCTVSASCVTPARSPTRSTAGRPVVALESTIIAHGLPRPENLEVALAVEEVVREEGAMPATIAIVEGMVRIGLDREGLEAIAPATTSSSAARATWRW